MLLTLLGVIPAALLRYFVLRKPLAFGPAAAVCCAILVGVMFFQLEAFGKANPTLAGAVTALSFFVLRSRALQPHTTAVKSRDQPVPSSDPPPPPQPPPSGPAATPDDHPTTTEEIQLAKRWDIGWGALVAGALFLSTVDFRLDHHSFRFYAEVNSKKPGAGWAWAMDDAVESLSVIPLGAFCVGLPLFFLLRALSRRRKMGFKPIALFGIILWVGAGFAYEKYSDWSSDRRYSQFEAEAERLDRQLQGSVELFDMTAKLKRAYTGSLEFFITGRAKNNSSKSLQIIRMKILIYGPNDVFVDTREVSVLFKEYGTDKCEPGEVKPFSGNTEVGPLPEGFKWTYTIERMKFNHSEL